jgi:hypothetical protein
MYSKLSDTAMISDNSNVELDEPKIWNCSAAPLLLQLEKEMEDEVKIASSEQGAQVCDAIPPEAGPNRIPAAGSPIATLLKKRLSFILLSRNNLSSQNASDTNNERNCATKMDQTSTDHQRPMQRRNRGAGGGDGAAYCRHREGRYDKSRYLETTHKTRKF